MPAFPNIFQFSSFDSSVNHCGHLDGSCEAICSRSNSSRNKNAQLCSTDNTNYHNDDEFTINCHSKDKETKDIFSKDKYKARKIIGRKSNHDTWVSRDDNSASSIQTDWLNNIISSLPLIGNGHITSTGKKVTNSMKEPSSHNIDFCERQLSDETDMTPTIRNTITHRSVNVASNPRSSFIRKNPMWRYHSRRLDVIHEIDKAIDLINTTRLAEDDLKLLIDKIEIMNKELKKINAYLLKKNHDNHTRCQIGNKNKEKEWTSNNESIEKIHHRIETPNDEEMTCLINQILHLEIGMELMATSI